jgi:hypothetical protein
VAIAVLSPLLFVVPAAIVISGKATLDALAYVGTVGTFGFMVAYALCSLAAPFWLQRLGVRTWALGFVSAVAVRRAAVDLRRADGGRRRLVRRRAAGAAAGRGGACRVMDARGRGRSRP